jgi:hypothetical protein
VARVGLVGYTVFVFDEFVAGVAGRGVARTVGLAGLYNVDVHSGMHRSLGSCFLPQRSPRGTVSSEPSVNRMVKR